MSAPSLTDAQARRLTAPRWGQMTTFAPGTLGQLLSLARELRLALDGAEVGAPMVDPERPLTSGAPWQVLAERLGTADTETLVTTWVSLPGALRLLGFFGQVAPGTYTLGNVTADELFEDLRGYPGLTPERAGLLPGGQVALSADQIALIRNQYWGWTDDQMAEEILEDGAWPGPSVDAKRPYGDMSFIANDIHRILDWPVEARDADGWIQVSDAQVAAARALHLTMLPATQVFLENATLDPEAPEVQEVVAQWAEDAQ